VARPWQRKFLGYSVTWHKAPKVRIAPASRQRLIGKLRQVLRCARGRNLQRTIETLNPILRGWPPLQPNGTRNRHQRSRQYGLNSAVRPRWPVPTRRQYEWRRVRHFPQEKSADVARGGEPEEANGEMLYPRATCSVVEKICLNICLLSWQTRLESASNSAIYLSGCRYCRPCSNLRERDRI
jgi:hypothetical protein